VARLSLAGEEGDKRVCMLKGALTIGTLDRAIWEHSDDIWSVEQPRVSLERDELQLADPLLGHLVRIGLKSHLERS